jgi:ABC-type glutathione transport system ATPase component
MNANPGPLDRADKVLRVRGLSKHYRRGRAWRKTALIQAVLNVDFEICAGQTLAIVGASGCGKSTVARCISRLDKPDAGEVWIDDREISRLNSHDLVPIRSKIQMIFQDALTSMNPRFSAAEAIEEPLRIQGRSSSERQDIVEQRMKAVGLSPAWLQRPVTAFSGGQQQRLAIARALTVCPKLLILDEAFSGLDLSTQAEITNLLLDLQQTHRLTYLLISHDLTHVMHMSDHVAVMSEGRILECATPDQLMSGAAHPESRQLLASAHPGIGEQALSAGAHS